MRARAPAPSPAIGKPPFAYAVPGLCHSRSFMTDTAQAQDLGPFARDPGPLPGRRASAMAAALVGSEILRIAAEIRALAAAGHRICDLTVGDFDPRQFPIPELLGEAIRGRARARGDELPAVERDRRRCARRSPPGTRATSGLDYPVESVVIASGSRPVIYALYPHGVRSRATAWSTRCRAGTTTTTSTWWARRACPIACGPEDRFLPAARRDRARAAGRAAALPELAAQPHRHRVHRRRAARASAEEVVAENARREKAGERPLYLMYDQVYWTLCFGDTAHVTPPELRARGRALHRLRGRDQQGVRRHRACAWAGRSGPTDIIAQMSAILGHMGAWAPRAEQVGTVDAARPSPTPSARTRRPSSAASRRGSTGCTPACRRCARGACRWRASRRWAPST